jgi:carbamoyl-phosphate synthase large subunit
MPRHEDIRSVVVIGSGPITIGQACEFDYSGTQGVHALAEEGVRVVVVNSNPATIMTDPDLASRTYIEPLEPASVSRVLERERPDALLPTLGGQTALNLALQLTDDGTLDGLGIRLIGSSARSIRMAERRDLFRDAMARIGLSCPAARYVASVDEGLRFADTAGYPLVLRSSFTLGGDGGGIVRSEAQLRERLRRALAASADGRMLVEESVLGWKEFELEVVRDAADNFIVVCSIENVDPMGVHTGDSITVAPVMTLTDREYQRLRDAARAVMSEIGVTTGGANVQFAVDPLSGRFHVIEMNPRVSRSSALASKATGYPIARVATKLALGYRLDEVPNTITGTSAAMEPTLDYVVVKWPRFTFERFPGADRTLGTQMKSIGEVMAIGRTFVEAAQKAACSLETGDDGLVRHATDEQLLARVPEAADADDALRTLLATPSAERLFDVVTALERAWSDEAVCAATMIDRWFVAQLRRIVDAERALSLSHASLLAAKRMAFSDAAIARRVHETQSVVRARRGNAGIRARFARVDTCAAELDTRTPYLYSHFEGDDEAEPSDRRKVIILGAGPNRIGQGLEFDYCCVHAAFALRELGVESVMINCNPETVSTDYDIADRLYFEPLTLESVLAICEEEASRGRLEGVIVQLGGQTPLRLSVPLARAGVTLLGTSAETIDRAEDRIRFDAFLGSLGVLRPEGRAARDLPEAIAVAKGLGYPVLVRPSYVLGGQAMAVCHSAEDLAVCGRQAFAAAAAGPLLIDRFLGEAVEVDVDCLCDGADVYVAAILEHVERAGVHSGDSAAAVPPFSLGDSVLARIVEQSERIGRALHVVGLMNIQFAVAADDVFVLEVNPRASRTVPFVAKATGLPIAKIAVHVMLGRRLADFGLQSRRLPFTAVKEAVFPFARMAGADPVLGPEMRSTGEVMGIAPSFAQAFGKATRAAGPCVARRGDVLLSLAATDAVVALEFARRLRALGFGILATAATAHALAGVVDVHALCEHAALDELRDGRVTALFVTATRRDEIDATRPLRVGAVAGNVPYFTTVAAGRAILAALEADQGGPASPLLSLQEWHLTL